MAIHLKSTYHPKNISRLKEQPVSKSEYIAGTIVAMSGASRKHNLIVTNIVTSLVQQLRGRSCEVYANDMCVKMPVSDLYVYPDVVVVCGTPQFEDSDLDTLLNPTLVIEVLSQLTRISRSRGEGPGISTQRHTCRISAHCPRSLPY